MFERTKKSKKKMEQKKEIECPSANKNICCWQKKRTFVFLQGKIVKTKQNKPTKSHHFIKLESQLQIPITSP